MKQFITFTILFFSVYLNSFDASCCNRFSKTDTVIVLDKRDNTTLSYHYISLPNYLCHVFLLENEKYKTKIIINKEDGVYELGSLSFNVKKNEEEKTSHIEFQILPYKYYLYLKDTLSLIISDIEKTYDFINIDGIDMPKYTYRVQDYWNNRTGLSCPGIDGSLKSVGRECCAFDADFDFELGEGQEYGKWLYFNKKVLKSKQFKKGSPDFVFNDVGQDFDMGRSLFRSHAQWNLTDDRLILEFVINNIRTFYLEIDLKLRPIVRLTVQREEDRLIEHQFDTDGNLSSIAFKEKDKSEIYYYEPRTGMLVKKETKTDKWINTYLQEIYNTEKEYSIREYENINTTIVSY